MKTYLITYDLMFKEDGPSYFNLFNRIKSFQLWARPTKNAWLIKTTSSAGEVYNFLKPALYLGDKVLIIQVTNDWISFNLSNEVVTWMKGGL